MSDETPLGVLVSALGAGNGTTSIVYACPYGCGAAVIDLPAHIRWHQEQKAGSEDEWLALWDCLVASGADVSEYTYETHSREGRTVGYEEFRRRGVVAEVVAAVEQLRNEYDEACDEAWTGSDPA